MKGQSLFDGLLTHPTEAAEEQCALKKEFVAIVCQKVGVYVSSSTKPRILGGYSKESNDMKPYHIVVSISHPPYPTPQRSGPSVNSPLPEHVDIAFRYAAEYGGENVGDIWIEWNIKDEEGNLLEVKQLLFAVSKDLDCCFAARTKEQNGLYENLVWNHGSGSEEIITIQDSGCGEWRFNAGSKVPVVDAIALAKRFVAEGYIGDDLEWEFAPTASGYSVNE